MADACCSHDHTAAPAGGPATQPARLRDAREIRLAAAAGVLLAIGFLAGFRLDGLSAGLAYVPALVVGGTTFVPEALRGLWRRRLGVDTLMAAAAIGAVALGEFGEAASLAFLFSISEGLEAYALTRTRRGLRALLDLVPPEVTLRRDGVESRVPAADIGIGDKMIVRPGERVATDGVIDSGRSALDLSAITGESVPVEHGPGDEVYAGAINGGAVLEVEATATTKNNTLARIVHIVEEAQERKAGAQRLAERIARPLVPSVFVVAALIAGVGSLVGDPTVWIERSLVVLVATAPGAFAISVPVTVVAGIGAASRSGVLIKGGAAVEALGRVHTVAIDKTGTLTRNDPRVVAVVPTPGRDEDVVLGVAAALERHSEHPLARAFTATCDAPAAAAVEAVAGHGLLGDVHGKRARLGKPSWVAPPESLMSAVEGLTADGATVVVVELAGEVIGAIGVRDDLRPEAFSAVERLREIGIRSVEMLTGDNRRTARALADEAGIDRVRAELLPEHKAAAVESLSSSGPVAMVGDGVNDAPALAVADVGIAMGAMGTDVAIEAADVALMGDDLRVLPETFAHAQRTVRIVRQNLALSGFILVALVPLAAAGMIGLAAAVATHELAEVLVIGNGVRAGRRLAPLPPSSTPAPARASREPRTPAHA